MKRLILLVLMLTASHSIGQPVPSLIPARLAVVKPTNVITRITFGWQYPSNLLSGIASFRLYWGSQTNSYTNSVFTGTNSLTYQFVKTNWTERAVRHFYSMTAVDVLGLESKYSEEAHWPLFSPDHMMLSWSNKVSTMIQSSTDLSLWSNFAMVAGTNSVTFSDPTNTCLFFRLKQTGTNQDRLIITHFNPLN